jgi:hypothetical protein
MMLDIQSKLRSLPSNGPIRAIFSQTGERALGHGGGTLADDRFAKNITISDARFRLEET